MHVVHVLSANTLSGVNIDSVLEKCHGAVRSLAFGIMVIDISLWRNSRLRYQHTSRNRSRRQNGWFAMSMKSE